MIFLQRFHSICFSITVLVLGFYINTAQADALLMVRTTQTFPEAMLKLQETINKQGYVVSRVQRIDIGLTTSGYKTDKYRVVFFGKPEQIKNLSDKYPHLIPYLPFKISIFAEGEETLLVTINPSKLKEARYPELDAFLETMESDINAILAIMGQDN